MYGPVPYCRQDLLMAEAVWFYVYGWLSMSLTFK
jgi:hypothetical protein